jgi:hypothetical protein
MLALGPFAAVDLPAIVAVMAPSNSGGVNGRGCPPRTALHGNRGTRFTLLCYQVARPDGSAVTGWAARRGPGFKNPELGPFPRSLPPNPAGTFQCTGLSRDRAAFATGLAWM